MRRVQKKVIGFTIVELLLATVMISLVLMGAFSLYTSGINLFTRVSANDITILPEPSLEELVRRIKIANFANINPGLPDTQLNLRADVLNCDPSVPDPAGPGNFTNDSWWHYRFINNQLLSLCDTNQNTVLNAVGNPQGTVATMINLQTTTGNLPAYPPGTGSGRSGFQIVNPSLSGNATVVHIHVNSTNPAKELNTEVAIGMSSKR